MARFQATKADREDTRKLLEVINRKLEGAALAPQLLTETFDKWWPELEKDLRKAIALETTAKPKSRRETADMVEETLALVRNQYSFPPYRLWSNLRNC
jgi:hypothetical protein